jgi:trans-2,3-dihydro-3-hydroxyanthranilate isomerase
MSRSYLHYDVFTGTPLLGNQLAVFTDGRDLSTAQMQAMAREMNFAESTFILPAETSGTDIRMRIFTPHLEMPMAGHPTIGSTFALAYTGVIPPGSGGFVFGLNIGPVPVDLEWDDGRLRFAWMTQSNPTFGPPVHDRASIAAAIGLTSGDLVPDRPIQIVSCGVPYLLVVLRDRQTVDRAMCDGAAFRRLSAEFGAELGVFLFAVASADVGAETDVGAAFPGRRSPEGEGGRRPDVYSRMFAPEHGVVEDPATGSASGPLGCYLVRHGIVSGDAQRAIISTQGVAMGRASRIHVSIAGSADSITEVKVGGEAVLIGKGDLLV